MPREAGTALTCGVVKAGEELNTKPMAQNQLETVQQMEGSESSDLLRFDCQSQDLFITSTLKDLSITNL